MNEAETLNENLLKLKTEVFDLCSFVISNVKNEQEGKTYDACQFELNGMKVISRTAKVTPKKLGQFVTFWKRNLQGITQPFCEADRIDFYMVNVRSENKSGQFVFPKSELIAKGIISSKINNGKRGFRVYPGWDIPQTKQAEKTQKWQLNYFYEFGSVIDLVRVKRLYNRNQECQIKT